MFKGEIWKVRLPPSTSRVQTGDRPALVVQNDGFTPVLATVLSVPLNGSVSATRFPGTLFIQPDATNGLRIPSVALVFQTRAIDKQDFLNLMGTLAPSTLSQVLAILNQLTA